MGLVGGILGGMFTFLAIYMSIFVIGSLLHKTPDKLYGSDDLNEPKKDEEK